MTKRNWTDEQRAAARERMNKARAVRMANLERARTAVAEPLMVIQETLTELAKPNPVRERDPEVQAILDTMSPERKAKLEMIQAKTLSSQEAQDAIARHEAEKVTGTSDAPFSTPPARTGSREVSLIVKTDGTMVSQYGPCICGAAKREWHKICAVPRVVMASV